MDKGAEIYRRYIDGDETAFDELMKEFFFPLVFFVAGIVGDRDAAEDIAMDAFTVLVVSKGRYNPRYSFKTYLYTIGKRKAIDYLRHRKTIEIAPMDADAADDGESVEEKVLSDERSRALYAALDRLDEDRREAIHLFFFENMPYSEIARVMKKSEKQVANLIYRGKEALRDILGGADL